MQSGSDMISGRDIVVVGLQPWDTEIGSNCKDVAVEFSKHNRVLYVNYPLDRGTLLRNSKDPKVIKRRNVIRGKEEGLVTIQPNMWNLYPDTIAESINWLPTYGLFDMLNKVNNERLAVSIRKAMGELDFTNIILFNDNDIMRSLYLKELLRPAVSVYYYRDYILGVPYWRKHGKRTEPELIRKSDVCVTNSFQFADHCRQYNPNTYYVGQGCDLELYGNLPPHELPEDLRNIPGPIIGYVGALQSIRLDLDLLAYLAAQRPQWSIVLVGPEDSVFKNSALHKYPNIHFLGHKSPTCLPFYIKAFDVCLNPQLMNEITEGNYPRKIDEYLAVGKPVVATRTKLMEMVFNDNTYLASSHAEYIMLIEKALVEDAGELQEGRKAFAHTHTWEAHVRHIYAAINTFEANKGKK